MSNLNELAAYLYIYGSEVQLDPNENIENAEDIAKFNLRAKRLSRVVSAFNLQLYPEITEEELTIVVYDIAKLNYGNSKEAIKQCFMDLYILLFIKKIGPRLPTFIKLVGINFFIKKLNDRFKYLFFY